MRMLNPNGILAMVLPSYFMDNVREHARDIIAQDGGRLIAAFRLPDDLFASYPELVIGIPMLSDNVRSHNLSTAVAIVLYEALRQTQQ